MKRRRKRRAPQSKTDAFRVTVKVLFAIVVLAAVVGFFMDKDPNKLGPVISWCTGALALGEASNIGKRITYRPDHHENVQNKQVRT